MIRLRRDLFQKTVILSTLTFFAALARRAQFPEIGPAHEIAAMAGLPAIRGVASIQKDSAEKPRFQKVMIGKREVRLVEFRFNLDESTAVRCAGIIVRKPWGDRARVV